MPLAAIASAISTAHAAAGIVGGLIILALLVVRLVGIIKALLDSVSKK